MARTQVNFRIGEDRREQWDRHVEQSPHYDKVSDLIKEAVRNQIERDKGNADPSSVEIDAQEGGVSGNGEILERIQNLRNDMQDLEAEVSDAVDAVHAQSGVDSAMFTEVFDVLPEGEHNATHAVDLAEATTYSASKVRFALENLRQNTQTVRKASPLEAESPEGGVMREARWYKTEGA